MLASKCLTTSLAFQYMSSSVSQERLISGTLPCTGDTDEAGRHCECSDAAEDALFSSRPDYIGRTGRVSSLNPDFAGKRPSYILVQRFHVVADKEEITVLCVAERMVPLAKMTF